MDETEMFEGLEEFDHKRYEAEVEQRWAGSDAYRESKRRTSRYGKADWTRIKKEGDAVVARLAELLARGARADGREAMDLAEEHRRHIDRWFYPCSPDMHRELAEAYTADSRFEAYFEKHGSGLAGYVQEAIRANEGRSVNR